MGWESAIYGRSTGERFGFSWRRVDNQYRPLVSVKSRRATFGWLVAFVGPLAFATAYLLLSRWQMWFTGDWVALAIAVAIGVAGLRMTGRATGAASFVYVCVATFVLFWYSLIFVCSVFQDCL